MNESIISFGPGRRLVGTLTMPTGPHRDTAVLLLNAGVIQRMGPHRINVKLARALAAQGHVVLRLDLSGQGDSLPSESTLSYEQQAVADLQAAMDHLQQTLSLQQFALAGICSGAHHGVTAALADPRLRALWLMDTHAYPTRKTYWVRMCRQLRLDPAGTVKRWVGKLAQRLAARVSPASAPASALGDAYPSPAKADFAQRLQGLIDRQVRVQIVYTGGLYWFYNYREQWRDTFREHGAVADLPVAYLREADHTVSTLSAQRQLVGSVLGFVQALR